MLTRLSIERDGRNENGTSDMIDILERLIGTTSDRATFLWKKVHFDVAEVILVFALWCNLFHRLYLLSIGQSKLDVYNGMRAVIGDDVYTVLLVLLGVIGLMNFMLYLPKWRREIDLLISTYFVVSGLLIILDVHDSLLGVYHIVVFGGAGAWTYWRQGLKK